ncbi:MAG: cytochrome c [Burkholderiales bacterium]|nr:cytochrome c [Burkholderiales bacterium]
MNTKTSRAGLSLALAIAALCLSGVAPRFSATAQAQETDDRPVIVVPRAGGRELFQSCVLCHKYDGRGGPSEGGYGADLRVTKLSYDELVQVIADGRMEKGMPAFKGILDDSKIATLANFIRNDLRLKDQQ